jgi:hypothetical protein
MRNRIWFERVDGKLLGSFILAGMLASAASGFFCAEAHAQAKPAKIKIKKKNPDRTMQEFSKDLALIKKHTQAIVLSNPGHPSKVVVAPGLQGRVLTSTAAGDKSVGFGWFDRKALATMSIGKPAVSVLGGEDRLLVGPEGTKFSFFYPAGTELAFAQRKIPAALDLEGFEVVQTNPDNVLLRKNMTLTNRAGHSFAIELQREVRILGAMDVQKLFGMMLPDAVQFVAYQTDNRLIQKGGEPWNAEKGLVSLRVVNAQTASPTSVAVVPYQRPSEASNEEKFYQDDIFRDVPDDRVTQDESAVYFLGDAKKLGKVSVVSKHTKGLVGSYDPSNKVLTIIQFDQPQGDAVAYTGARLDENQPLLGGQAIYLLNEGPIGEGGKSRGRFFMLETASPASLLKPGEALRHVQRTLHFQGPEEELDVIMQTVLKTSKERIQAAFDVDEDEEQEEETEEEESEDDETGTDE